MLESPRPASHHTTDLSICYFICMQSKTNSTHSHRELRENRYRAPQTPL
jgi:hypothetical protein